MKLLFCGDSTMAGMTGTEAAGYVVSPYNMPAVVQGLVGPGIVCQNAGVGGTKTPEWLNGIPGMASMPSWDARMSATDAGVVLCNTGINDVFIPGYDYTKYRAEMAEMIRIARVHGKGIIFMTPNPINRPHNDALWGFQNGVLVDLGPVFGAPVINIYNAVGAACPAWPGMLPDGVHPNNDLYRLMGNITYAALVPILGLPLA